ncbi:MAG: nucleotide exchange factor GrpE [Synergistaceae bacterium]|jgi:molecular chaperone GrpE|nr:nucleotide exchange factor GrpE [Synergistaceae bacterium]
MEEHGRDNIGVSEEQAPFFPAPALGSEIDDDAYRDLNEVLGSRQFKNVAGSSERALSDKATDSETDSLKKENEALKVEAGELKNQLAAARADLYNYRQRTERERLKTLRSLTLDRIGDFLPVLDNLDRALAVPENGTARDVLVGVRMVQRQFLSVLEDAGVTSIPAEGCVFDPALHDAIETETVNDSGQDGMILCELSRGYRSAERVLRAARVRVGRFEAKEQEPAEDPEETETL